MPDQFDGDIAPNSTNRVTSPTTETIPDPESQTPATPSLLDRIKLGFADTAKSFVLDMWLARQTPEKVLPRLLKVIKAAQEEYADAIAHGDGLYAVGYCFGARYVLILAGNNVEQHPAIAPPATTAGGADANNPGGASGMLQSASGVISGAFSNIPAIPGLSGGAKTDSTTSATNTAEADEESQPALPTTDPATTTASPSAPPPSAPITAHPLPPIRAAAIAHGTLITRDDVRGVSGSVPLYVVAVQDDPLFPEEVLEVGRKVWAANEARCHVEVFDGVPHGFAVVGEYDDPKIREGQERAWKGMRGWLDGF
jgi:dienelactone hydrolase